MNDHRRCDVLATLASVAGAESEEKHVRRLIEHESVVASRDERIRGQVSGGEQQRGRNEWHPRLVGQNTSGFPQGQAEERLL